MTTVRCLRCQTVFATQAESQHANVRCPACGATHRLGSLASSSAGESMLISPVVLKQILQSPRGPESAPASQPREPVFLCPSCKVRLYVDRRKYGGKTVNCPQCQKPMLIPRRSQQRDEPENSH